MKYLSYIFISVLIGLTTVLSGATTPTELLAEANALAKQSKYAEATSLYEQIVETDYVSDDLYYNLGTAYVHQSKPGEAVLYLKRALKINPQHNEALQNLKLARNLVSTEVIAIPEFFLLRYWTSFANMMGSTLWACLGLLLLVAMVFGFYKWLIGTDPLKRKKAFYLAVISTALFLVSFLAGMTQHKWETNSDFGVIMTDTQLLSGADARSEELYPLSAGVEAKLIDKIGDFYKIKLLDQEVGWVNQDKLRVI